MKGSELPSVADRRCCSGALSQINEPTPHAFRVEKSKSLTSALVKLSCLQRESSDAG